MLSPLRCMTWECLISSLPLAPLCANTLRQGCSVSHVGGQSLIMRSFTSAFVFQCIENDAQDWYDVLSVFIMKANEAVTNVRSPHRVAARIDLA